MGAALWKTGQLLQTAARRCQQQAVKQAAREAEGTVCWCLLRMLVAVEVEMVWVAIQALAGDVLRFFCSNSCHNDRSEICQA
jgi:hypothetical protein